MNDTYDNAHPAIKEQYFIDKEYNRTMTLEPEEEHFEDWMDRKFGKVGNYAVDNENDERYLGSTITIRIRYFDSLQTHTKLVQINLAEKHPFADLMDESFSKDLITVDGKSMINEKKRTRFSKYGPEFYLVKKDELNQTTIKLDILPRHETISHNLMLGYTTSLVDTITKLVTARLISSKNQDETDLIFKNSEMFIKQILEKAINNVEIQVDELEKTYSADQILSILRKYTPEEKRGKNLEQFKSKMINNMMNNFGSEIITFLHHVPRIWAEMYYKKENDLSLREEAEHILGKIKGLFNRSHPNPLGEIRQICNDMTAIIINEQPIVYKRKQFASRRKLFRDVKLPCQFCHSIECEAKKFSRVKGIIMENSNNTYMCPQKMFEHRLQEDKIMKERFSKASKVLQLDKKGQIKIEFVVILPCKRIQDFDKRKHGFMMKNVITTKDGFKMIKKRNSSFSVIQNDLKGADDDPIKHVIEHADFINYPGFLFLVEINDKDFE